MMNFLLWLTGGLLASEILSSKEMWCENCGASNKNGSEECYDPTFKHEFSPVNWTRELRTISGRMYGTYETLEISGHAGSITGITGINAEAPGLKYSKDGRVMIIISMITDHPFYSLYDNMILVESWLDLKTGKFTFFKKLSDPMDIHVYRKRVFI